MLAVQKNQHLTPRYETIRLVGAGGMGRVFEVLDHHTGKRVALKTPLGAAGGLDAKRLAVLFDREVSALKELEGPGVLRLLDSGRLSNGMPFIVTELLQGETLGERVKRAGRLQGKELELLARGALAAVQGMHESNVMHRDINPDNLFLSQTRGVVLIDFGLAIRAAPRGDKSLTAQLSLGLLGTPAYLAPERVTGEQASPQSDLYALGATLVFAATGRPMMEQATPVSLMSAIAKGHRPALRELCAQAGDGIGGLIDRLLAQDPEQRPSARAALAHLDAVTAPSATARTFDLSTQGLWWLVAALGLLVIGVATGATITSAQPGQQTPVAASQAPPASELIPLPPPEAPPLLPAELPPTEEERPSARAEALGWVKCVLGQDIDIAIDGVEAGRHSFAARLDLKAGKHTLRFSDAKGRTREVAVVAKPNKGTMLSIDLLRDKLQVVPL